MAYRCYYHVLNVYVSINLLFDILFPDCVEESFD